MFNKRKSLKFLSCFVLCLLTASAWGMHEQWRIELPEVGCAAAFEKRKKLSPEKQLELKTLLFKTLFSACERLVPIDFAYEQLRRLLDCGTNPDYSPLEHVQKKGSLMDSAVRMGDGKIIALLLAYGADPRQRVMIEGCPIDGHPIAKAVNVESLWLLTRAGADINGQDEFSGNTALISVCSYGDLSAMVWALLHGANPNGGPAREFAGAAYAIHEALRLRDLEKVVALLHYGARLDVETPDRGSPLIEADRRFNYDQENGFERAQISRAQLELLQAVNTHKLNPSHVYTLDEYKAMGILHESAELIKKATQAVNDAFVQCALDDFKHDHHENMANFAFGRELGRTLGRKK